MSINTAWSFLPTLTCFLLICDVGAYYPEYELTVETLKAAASDCEAQSSRQPSVKLRFNVTVVSGGFQVGYAGIWLETQESDGGQREVGRCYNVEVGSPATYDRSLYCMRCSIETYRAVVDLEVLDPPSDFDARRIRVGVDDYHFGFVALREPFAKIRYVT